MIDTRGWEQEQADEAANRERARDKGETEASAYAEAMAKLNRGETPDAVRKQLLRGRQEEPNYSTDLRKRTEQKEIAARRSALDREHNQGVERAIREHSKKNQS